MIKKIITESKPSHIILKAFILKTCYCLVTGLTIIRQY